MVCGDVVAVGDDYRHITYEAYREVGVLRDSEFFKEIRCVEF